MFNGIIFNQGLVKKIVKRKKGINLFLKSNLKVKKKDIGISIACDGVCLTLIKVKNNFFDLKSVLNKIYFFGCRNLLVEGGKLLTSSFLKHKLFNQFYLFKSPNKLGISAKLNISNQLNQLSFKYKKKFKLNAFTEKDIVYLYSK